RIDWPSSALLSPNAVDGMLVRHEGMTGQPAPRGNVRRRSWVTCDQLEDLPRSEAGHACPQLEQQFAAPHVACIPHLDSLHADPHIPSPRAIPSPLCTVPVSSDGA